jgi:hypothetical protein
METGKRVPWEVMVAGGMLASVGVAVGLWELGSFSCAASPTTPPVPVWQVSQPWLPTVVDPHTQWDMVPTPGATAVDPCWLPGWIGAPVDPPVPIEQPEDKVPRGCVGGVVLLDVVVDRSGAVREPRLLRSVLGCGDTAIALVSKWRYHPALWRGGPMGVDSCQLNPGDPFPVYLRVALRFDTARGDVKVEKLLPRRLSY